MRRVNHKPRSETRSDEPASIRARRPYGSVGAASIYGRHQKEEQDEDDKEHDRPTGVASKRSVQRTHSPLLRWFML